MAPDYLEHGTVIMWIHVRVDRPTFWADYLKLRTRAYLALCFFDAVVGADLVELSTTGQ